MRFLWFEFVLKPGVQTLTQRIPGGRSRLGRIGPAFLVRGPCVNTPNGSTEGSSEGFCEVGHGFME